MEHGAVPFEVGGAALPQAQDLRSEAETSRHSPCINLHKVKGKLKIMAILQSSKFAPR